MRNLSESGGDLLRASSKKNINKVLYIMKTTTQKLPYRISEYIKDHFREVFI